MGISGVITRGFLFDPKYVVTAGYFTGTAPLTVLRDIIGCGVVPFLR